MHLRDVNVGFEGGVLLFTFVTTRRKLTI